MHRRQPCLHVYYGRYLDWLEEARGELFRHAGCPFVELSEADLIFPVLECALKYRAPARYDDLLEVAVWLTALRGARMNVAYRIRRADGTTVLEATTRHVCTSRTEKPKRIPAGVTGRLGRFLFPDQTPQAPPLPGQ